MRSLLQKRVFLRARPTWRAARFIPDSVSFLSLVWRKSCQITSQGKTSNRTQLDESSWVKHHSNRCRITEKYLNSLHTVTCTQGLSCSFPKGANCTEAALRLFSQKKYFVVHHQNITYGRGTHGTAECSCKGLLETSGAVEHEASVFSCQTPCVESWRAFLFCSLASHCDRQVDPAFGPQGNSWDPIGPNWGLNNWEVHEVSRGRGRLGGCCIGSTGEARLTLLLTITLHTCKTHWFEYR